ncbi:hypothetical protein OPQ81_008087 [Rhizoctonia solani]|nr:hypothetical protein OPQ81_008087 [Rhizoctonia solani]
MGNVDGYLEFNEGLAVKAWASSFFIRDVETGAEVLIFGDVEADSISMHPETCSSGRKPHQDRRGQAGKPSSSSAATDDSRPADRLFGHLTPSFLIQEMVTLAEEVKAFKARQAMEPKEADDHRRGGKRKRDMMDDLTIAGRRRGDEGQ